MEAIHLTTIEQAGQSYQIAIYPDTGAPNPLEDWDEMGTILSLNRRLANFDPAGIAAATETNPDAVALGYYEHGLCCCAVAGELPLTCQCPWDSVAFAGLWLPDSATLDAARYYGGSTRRHFMRKRARQACDAYTQWCNGGIYGYTIMRLTSCPGCGDDHAEAVDSGWGFYGLDDCLNTANAVLA